MQLPESELVPESILPEQLRDHPLGGARIQPEKRLQVAVLAEAILTFQKWAAVERPRPRARHLFLEVYDWFASNEADGPFTFVAICQSLGLDPGYIRRGLRQWRARAGGTKLVRRDGSGDRHRVALPRLRRVA